LKVFGLRDGHNINPIQYFDSVLKTNNRNIEALFGKAKVRNAFNGTLLCLKFLAKKTSFYL